MIKLNGVEVPVTLFPDGTSQVWKVPNEGFTGKSFNIYWEFQSEGELFHLAQLVDLIRDFGFNIPITLGMDYLPYARQDKLVSNKNTFALITFSKIINSMGFDLVTFLDGHSEIAEHLIKNSKNIFPAYEIEKAVDACNPDILCFPDKGAIRRYGKDIAYLGRIHMYGDKVRDQQTGHIISYEIHGDVKDRNVLIVDDICDGGMTFILLTKQLLTNGAKSVNLYTTHGIYSKGLRPLREAGIKRIFNKDGEVGEIQGYVVNDPWLDKAIAALENDQKLDNYVVEISQTLRRNE